MLLKKKPQHNENRKMIIKIYTHAHTLLSNHGVIYIVYFIFINRHTSNTLHE